MEEHEVYAMIGEKDFTQLAAAFYRQVPEDDILGPMYPEQDPDLSVRRSAAIYRTERTSPSACTAFSISDQSSRSRPLDAAYEQSVRGHIL